MRLYSGSSKEFVEDATQNRIGRKLKEAYFNYFRYYPGPAEVASWENSLTRMSLVVNSSGLMDHGVILEYQLPLTSKRLDCMILGRDQDKRDSAVVIELKQWSKCEPSDGPREVTAWVGGAHRDLLHPSVQVGQYHQYLVDYHSAFYDVANSVRLASCAYLHNYSFVKDDPILDDKFKEEIGRYPIYSQNDVDPLKDFLKGRLSGGHGEKVLKRVETSKFRPSKKLMEHVGNVIKNKPEYILLDEQLIVYDRVLTAAQSGFKNKKKTVIIIKGGPGTGKSVIALNLMADLSLKGFNTHYATGSRAFTETLRDIIGKRGSFQFKYFNSYMEAAENEIDVMICDEAHRIRKTSNNRFTPKVRQSKLPQIDELLKASKVSAFFIDDNQIVRPDEIGSVQHIKEFAEKHSCHLFEYELEAQFRCNGSDAFVNWVNNTLEIKRTANVMWDQKENFDFKIMSSPQELESAIREKVQLGVTGRVTAGYCWEWSDSNPDGTLVNDVLIGDYQRPWNARPEAKKLAKDIPKALLWAHDPNGINQVGCVYTAQGFEFDYVGVIFGNDLRFNLDEQKWEAFKEESHDTSVKRGKDRFIDFVKNTYRVLLTRGMKGCYVYFMDKDTERFFKTRIEKGFPAVGSEDRGTSESVAGITILPFDYPGIETTKFKKYLPVYSLRAAAGNFGQGEEVNPEGWVDATGMGKLTSTMFIARISGHSMEPKIHDGDLCVFRLNPIGSRQGKIVLAQHRGVSDPETGGSFSVKEYHSEKKSENEDEWQHQGIELRPLNKEYSPIIISPESAENFIILAEYIGVVK